MKKVVSMLVCAVLSCCMFTGCGKAKVKNTETNCVVATYSGGYGMSAFKKLGKRFNEIYADEGLTVTFDNGNPNLTDNLTRSQLQAGAKVTKTDLFLPGNVNYRYIVDQGSKFVSGYDCGLEDLTDLLDRKVYGENKTFGEKADPQFMDGCAIEKGGKTKYYTVPYMGGTSGFAYNAKLFEDNGWEVPNTTDELKALLPVIKAAGATPFVWASGTGYWDYAVYVWWRQLVTDEECDDFWNCIDKDGEQSLEVFEKSAKQYRAFKILEDLIYDTKNSHEDCMIYEHIDAQVALYKSNKIAMMPTGDWLENEMRDIGYSSENIGMMKVPVASDILQVHNYQTIKDDATLSAVVKAIDNNEPRPQGVSDDDFNAIKKIRGYMFSNGFMFTAMIPSYANAKDVAKKFLLFLASDEAQQIFYNETHALLPFSADNLQRPQEPTRLQRYVLDGIGKTTYISNAMPKNPLFYNNGLQSWMIDIEDYVGTNDKKDKKNAEQFQAMNYEYFKDRLKGQLN